MITYKQLFLAEAIKRENYIHRKRLQGDFCMHNYWLSWSVF